MTAWDDRGDVERIVSTSSYDILVAGTPGPLLSWTCEHLAGAMARHHVRVAHLPISGTARWSPLPTNPAGRLFFGDLISEEWAAPLKAGLISAVVVLDDIPSAWHHLRQSGQQFSEAIRNLVAVATALGDLTGIDNVLVLPCAAWDNPAKLAARILDHVGLPPETFHHGLADLPVTQSPAIPMEAQSLIDAVVAPAFHYARSGNRIPATWPRGCLFWGDYPGESAPRVLDITGPARGIVYGPYYALPRGRWTVRATIAFSPSSCGASLALELHAADPLGRFEFKVDKPGLFAASFQVTVPSSREPLEIRLLTERGAIEGVLGIDRIDLIPDPA